MRNFLLSNQKFFLSITTSLVLLTGCANQNKKDEILYGQLGESFDRQNSIIESRIDREIWAIRQRMNDPSTVEKATYWKTIAEQVNLNANEQIKFIRKLHEYLGDDHPELGPRDAYFLYKRLENIRTSILNTEPKINKEFEKKLSIFSDDFRKNIVDDKQFYQVFFKGSTLSKTKMTLLKFENDIRNDALDLISYCNIQSTPGCILRFESFKSIITKNCTHFKSNEELIINAGIGEFQSRNNPVIFIDDKKIDLKNSVAVYKLKITNKTGKYKVPVKIIYTNQNGIVETMNDWVEYTVDE